MNVINSSPEEYNSIKTVLGFPVGAFIAYSKSCPCTRPLPQNKNTKTVFLKNCGGKDLNNLNPLGRWGGIQRIILNFDLTAICEFMFFNFLYTPPPKKKKRGTNSIVLQFFICYIVNLRITFQCFLSDKVGERYILSPFHGSLLRTLGTFVKLGQT